MLKLSNFPKVEFKQNKISTNILLIKFFCQSVRSVALYCFHNEIRVLSNIISYSHFSVYQSIGYFLF